VKARTALGAVALVAALLAGCGEHRPPSDAAVIRDWADTLRRGDVEGASRLFALPATVANGPPRQRLTTRAQVRAFNESLPCGARLLRTRRKGRYTVARFRLTERRGGDCGGGVGATAETAFRLRDGRIVEWLRVPTGDPPSGPPPGLSTS
jgi:SnoaL-like domain